MQLDVMKDSCRLEDSKTHLTLTPTPTPTTETNSTAVVSGSSGGALTKFESLLEYQNTILQRQLTIAEAEHELNKQLIPLQIEYYKRVLGLTPTQLNK